MTRKKWNRLRRQHPILRKLPSWELIGEELRPLSVPQVMAAITEQKLLGQDMIEVAGYLGLNTEFYPVQPMPPPIRSLLS